MVPAMTFMQIRKQEGISFFANGSLLRTYTIRELVGNRSALPETVSHFFWQMTGKLDGTKLEYTLGALDGNQFVFDIRNGAILQQHRPPILVWPLLFIFVLCGALLLMLWLASAKRKKLTS